MSNYRRYYKPAGQYFFTVVSWNRRPIITSDLARGILKAVWREVQERMPFTVDAVCLMPDHIHTIWTLPDGDEDYSMRWNEIKGEFSKRYQAAGGEDGFRNVSRRRRGEAAIWQRRFWEHLIRDERDYAKHIDYIHFNPVKHGYVEWPGRWEWSSFRRYAAQGFYDREWGAIEPESIKGYECKGECRS